MGALWALALTAAALLLFHPLVLLALTLAVLGAGVGAGVGRRLARTLRTAAIVGVPIVAINVLVSREGSPCSRDSATSARSARAT